MFEKVDTGILNKFTQFCHWFQRLTGRTNFFLAQFTIAGMVVALIAITVDNYLQNDSFWVFVGIVGTMALIKDIMRCKDADNLAFSSDRAIIEFVVSFNFPCTRVTVAAGSLFALAALVLSALERDGFAIIHLLIPCASISSYLVEVVPLPPGKSRIAQWLGDIAAYFSPQSVEAR